MARKKSQAKLAREFGYIWPIFTGLLAAVMIAPKWIGFLWWEAKPDAVVPLLAVGLSLLAISLIFRKAWVYFFRFWMHWIARTMAWVMTHVLLSLFFFLVMSPFVLLLRLFGKRFLDTEWKDGKDSYWLPREVPECELERYRKQF
jgi:hypothetical protein